MASGGGPAEPRSAATVVLVRDVPPGASGIEVLLLKRHRRSGFLPNAWVFPGGRVEEDDRTGPGDPHVNAAIRETFEEAGIHVDADLVRPWSWWVTPAAEPRRFDTRFFVAPAPTGEARHDDHETVASRWIAPADALSAGQSVLSLAPPTWWTLHELARHATVAEVLAARRHATVPIQPLMSFDEGGMRLVLPGHPTHPDPAIPGVPDRITWERDRWVAWRGDEVLTDRPPIQ